MMWLLLVVYSGLFASYAWVRFRNTVGFFIVLFPAYLLRFQIGPFPSTLLEISFAILYLVWLLKYIREDKQVIFDFVKQNKIFCICIGLFFIASILGVLVSDMILKSFGQWRAYFLEPILFFFLLIGRKKHISSRFVMWSLIFSTLSITLYGVVQKFTGWGIATPEWTNPTTRRVTAFFSSPNAVGLYVAPVVIIMFYFILEKFSSLKELVFNKKKLVATICLCLALAALLFTKSEGTIGALAVSLVLMVWLVGYKKSAVALVICGVVLSLLIPSVRTKAFFNSKSGQNRLVLWGYTESYLVSSPQHFFLGAGVRQFFRKIQKPYYDVKKMERLIYPHNIVLNFWSEIGFLGAASFIGLVSVLFLQAKKIKNSELWRGTVLICLLVVVVVHGMVDVPYFKNDLAMLFWTLAFLYW